MLRLVAIVLLGVPFALASGLIHALTRRELEDLAE
jgi:predicted outer membrane lipoprotein